MPNPDFRIIRSAKRKRIAFRFAPDGVLEVLSPMRTTVSVIRNLVAANQQIIENLRLRTPSKPQLRLVENELFWLLGRKFPLHLTRRLRIFDRMFMIPDDSEAKKKASLISLYQELAKKIIAERLKIYQPQIGCAPDKIRISSASTRWGSCSSKKTVSFSWKLIQCPIECIDYVIVHELVHLIELNHSPAFWQLVGRIIPDYRQKKEQLNSFAAQLPNWD